MLNNISNINFIISVLLIVACEKPSKEDSFYYQEKNAKVFKDTLTLKEYKTVRFPIDTSTGFYNKSICHFEGKNNTFVSILNALNQSIYIYNYSDGKLLKKVKLQKDGANGVGMLTGGSSHYIDTIDSIFVLNYTQQKLYLINLEGEVHQKYNLKGDDLLIACPSSTSRRILKIGNKLLLPCHLKTYYTDDLKSNAIITLDITTGHRSTIIPYPDVFNEGSWISPYKFIVSYVYNYSTMNLVVSFPVDPFIHTYDLSGNTVSQKFVGSKFIKKVLPYSNENSFRFNSTIPADRKETYLATSHNYCGLWFIPKKQLYIRELFIRPIQENVTQNIKPTKTSLIIFNKDLVKLGEYMLPDTTYETAMTFVNNEGLHIAKFSEYKKNENFLIFGLFKITKK